MTERVLILDFGSQYTQLIARRVREHRVYCEIHPCTVGDALVRDFAPAAIILSGGPASTHEALSPRAPQVAAASIGWQVSPFQFEVGVADIAIGLVGIIAFWRSLAFKSAVVGYITLFYAGVAIGHVQQAISAQNFAPNNFGLLLVLTIAKAVILPLLLARAWREERGLIAASP